MKKTQKPKHLILFTENFRKRITAWGLEEVNNLESYLNGNNDDNAELILDSARIWYKGKSGVYRPKTDRNYLAIKANQINLVYSSKKLEKQTYKQESIPPKCELSIMYGLKGLQHDLIGEVKVPNNNYLDSEKQALIYLTKQLNSKKFITFYNPRQRKMQKEFPSLFNGTALQDKNLNKILLNRTSYSATNKSIYLEPQKKPVKKIILKE